MREMKYEEARQKLLGLLGENNETTLENDNDGGEARLSKSSIGKLMANTTVRKSLDNGFTREQHYAAVSDVDNLFRKSVKVISHADKYGDPNVKAIHRFAAPLFGDNIAYITIKESTEHGKRLYTVELMKIGKLVGMLEEARDKSPTHFPSTSLNHENENNINGLGGMLEEAVETPLHTSRAPSPKSGGFTPPRLYNDNINKLRAAVNRKNKKS